MAGWNGSGDTGRARTPSAPQKKSGASSPLWLKGALAGVLVVAIGAAVLYMMRPAEKPVEKPKAPAKSAAIKPVVPAAAPTNAAPQVAKKKYADDPPGTVRREDGTIIKGWVTLPNGKKHYRRGLISEELTLDRRGKYSIFEDAVDNELAELVMLEGGAMLIGGPMNHRGKYKEAFLEAIKTPIIIKDDDTDEQKMIKRTVIETRKELKAALDRGEDIEKIVADTYKEAERLSTYKDEVRQMVMDAKKNTPDMSDQDMVDLLDAANKMLEEKGVAPLRLGAVTRARLRIRKQ